MSKLDPLNGGCAAARSVPSSSRGAARVAPLAVLSGIAALGIVPCALAQSSSGDGLEVFETFTAVGQGESRANNSLNLEALEIAMPGISPEKMVDKIPGVNVTTSDPFGFYEFANDIRVRAFNVANIGVTLDGVPVGTSDPRYGTPIGRLIDSANIATIKVSQGAGDVTTPAYQALGGSIQYFSKDPDLEPGAEFSAAYGSFDHVSLFAKYELGEFYPGLTGYISTSHFEFSPKGLEGFGTGDARRFEAKFKYRLPSDKLSLSYGLTYNDRDDYDTSSISYQEWKDLEAGNYHGTGKGWDTFYPWDHPTGFSASDYGDLSDQGRNYGPPTIMDPNTDVGQGVNSQYFNLWRNGRMDTMHRLIADWDLDDGKKLSFSTYYQDKNNYGLFGRDKSYAEHQIRQAYAADPDRTDIWGELWYNTEGKAVNQFGQVVAEYASSGTGAQNATVSHAIVAPGTPLAAYDAEGKLTTAFVPGVPGRTARDESFGGNRLGATVTYTWQLENHKIIAGGWWEQDYHNTARWNYNLEGGSILGRYLYDQPNFLNYTRTIDQDVMQFWAQDTMTMGKFQFIAGVKAIKLDRDARGFLTIAEWINNTETFRSTTYEDYFLPQLGALYELSDNSEIFFNYSENMATPNSGTITTGGVEFTPDLLAPEYSQNFDLGLRGNVRGGSYTLQGYYIKYTDRILSSTVPLDSPLAGAAGNSVYQNVGGVDSWGLEAAGDISTPIEGLKFSGSLALQKSTFQEDLLDGYVNAATMPTAAPGYRYEATSTAGRWARYQDIGGNDLGNTPFVTANFDAIYRKGQFRYTFGGKYFDDVYLNTLNTQPLEAYTVFDASMSYSGKKDTALEGMKITLSAYNIFDQYFFVAASYTSTSGAVRADRGRQFTLKFDAEF